MTAGARRLVIVTALALGACSSSAGGPTAPTGSTTGSTAGAATTTTGDDASVPSTTAAQGTTAEATTDAPTTAAAVVAAWTPVANPVWPEETADAPPASGPWPSGTYWAYPVSLDAGPPVVIEVQVNKVVRGGAIARLPADQRPEDCPNDYCVLPPQATGRLTLTDAVAVTVTDQVPTRSFRVPLAELVRLWNTGSVAGAEGVPTDFTFSNAFPLLVTIVDGTVKAVAQQWVP